jgi:hypothetical protein
VGDLFEVLPSLTRMLKVNKIVNIEKLEEKHRQGYIHKPASTDEFSV